MGRPPKRRAISALPALSALGALLVLPVSTACDRASRAEVPQPAVASDGDARKVVASFLDAYVAEDMDGMLKVLCEQDARSQAAARRWLGMMLEEVPLSSYSIHGVSPAWVGDMPYFEVAVGFPRRDGGSEVPYAYRVRAQQGCIENFLGGVSGHGPSSSAPEGQAPPHEAPAPLPDLDAPALEAPTSPEDTVIDL
jgi:hypothetical protein